MNLFAVGGHVEFGFQVVLVHLVDDAHHEGGDHRALRDDPELHQVDAGAHVALGLVLVCPDADGTQAAQDTCKTQNKT